MVPKVPARGGTITELPFTKQPPAANVFPIGDRSWQIDKSRFRSTLAGCTVTIHEHLNRTVSIHYGPHVVGWFYVSFRFYGSGHSLQETTTQKRRGKTVENQTQVSHGSHRPLEISPTPRDFHFSTAPTTPLPKSKIRKKAA